MTGPGAGQLLREHRARRALTQEDVARELAHLSWQLDRRAVEVTGATVSRWERGTVRPGLRYARLLAHLFDVTVDDLGLGSVDITVPVSRPDAVAAADLARSAEASDTGDRALDIVEGAVDDLCRRYAGISPAVLLPEVRGHLDYVQGLLDRRLSHRHRRRTMAAAGWLSLLAACVHVDIGEHTAAAARCAAVDAIADQLGHTELAAWPWEVRAWRALTLGRPRDTLDLAATGLQIAPARSSARMQLLAQTGRAHARLGDRRETRSAVRRAETDAARLSTPERPDHHFVYDPAKVLSYLATTLAWSGDTGPAEDYARQVIDQVQAAAVPKPRRLATARLDLGLVLAADARPEEALHEAALAARSGQLVPSNSWRAHEVVDVVRHRWPTLPALHDFDEQLALPAPAPT